MNPQYSRYYTYVKPIVNNAYVKTYSTLVFSLIAITIFSLFAIRPTVKTILGLQKNINEQKETLNKLTEKSQNLETGRKNYQNIDPNLKAKVDALLPSKTNIPDFVDEITLLSLRTQASISGIQFQPVEIDNNAPASTTDPKLQEISFTLNALGQYNQLLNLLNALNYSSRLISINTVSFNKTELGTLVMSVNGKAYYLK